jgi:hypothetical protein
MRNLMVSYEKIGDYPKLEEIKMLLTALSAGDDDPGSLL